MKPVGIRVKHATLRSCVHVVPVLAKPYADGGFLCPTCHVWHPVKAVHLWLDDQGTCIVSRGVLDELRLAGMPELTIVGHVNNPPTLTIRKGFDRAAADQENRRITVWQENPRAVRPASLV